ncbi:MAG: trehalose-phosphatase [Methylocella sp.]
MKPGDLARIAPLSSCAYFLDVDGTLLDIMPRPEGVAAEESLKTLLAGLVGATRGALGLVSGRAIKGIDRIFAPLVFPAAGLHGAEIRFPDGSRSGTPTGREMDCVRQPLADFIAAHPSLRLEDKGAALAVQEGKMVAKLKQAHRDKGNGIAALLASPPFWGRKPVFIGDDLTDESGFRFVNAQGGVSVRVGAAGIASDALYRLPDPASVRTELHRLLAGR